MSADTYVDGLVYVDMDIDFDAVVPCAENVPHIHGQGEPAYELARVVCPYCGQQNPAGWKPTGRKCIDYVLKQTALDCDGCGKRCSGAEVLQRMPL